MLPVLRAMDALRQRAEARTLPPAHALGRKAEDLAHRYLQRQGLRVVARNWRPPGAHGEVDLVALDGDRVAFVEVKAKTSAEFSAPDRNVDAAKIRALRRSAFLWLRVAGEPEEKGRLDLITVVFSEPPQLSYQPDFESLVSRNQTAHRLF